ncbi:MAG: DUF4342 domain-containing protein [Trueperaceae bacterium]|nr:DUF4342 domain-containing protein [Trueperaceae bacterium]
MHDHHDATTTGDTTPGSVRRPANTSVGARFSEAAGRLGASLEDLVRRGNRRSVTLRGRTGTTWLRLPLTLAVVLVVVASVAWLPLVIVATILLFALRAEIAVDRRVVDRRVVVERDDASAAATRSDTPGSAV